MKKSLIFHSSLIVIIFQISCSSTKDIVMFQAPEKDLNQFYVPQRVTEHKIVPFDNLYLSVLTLDPEVNKLFDPSLAGNGLSSGTEQMYGTPTSQHINGYRVSAKGTITLPIIGKIILAGLSLNEAQDRLRERTEEYLKEPTVQVKFLNYKVNISGEIKNPGIYYNYEGSINLLDAISMANGTTDYADLKNVMVKRYHGDRIYTHKINLTDNSVFSSDIYYLQPNDLVYIPPSELKRRRENSDTYSKILSTISTLLVAVALFMNL